MSNAFEYRPKFVDIRVKRGAKTAAARDPSETRCDHIGCKNPGLHRAPKGRDNANQFWHFCVEHAADYNKRWDYFSGMSDGEFKDYLAREEVGHRPTWTFRGGRLDRHSAAMRSARRGDPFSLFGSGDPEAPPTPRARRLTRLQVMALEAMSLDENADAVTIRTRYADLVKRWHPDSNGGDRSAETNLQRVIKAYQHLKAGGLV
jgi:hypothetical protein